MNFELKGETALVLGGGRGLGRALAKSLSTEGANVAVADIGSTSSDGTAADLKAIGGKCKPWSSQPHSLTKSSKPRSSRRKSKRGLSARSAPAFRCPDSTRQRDQSPLRELSRRAE
jgi:NAD(P)-dependent dehydrogenase (short-subunit alcohol dehydrogenase family)